MFIWCALLFFLGVMAFLDSVFNMGMIFRQVNSVLFMLISVALLVRTTSKMKEKRVESYQDKIFQLERRILTLEEGRKKLESY